MPDPQPNLEPVKVTMIGTGTGDGTGTYAAPMPTGTVAVTSSEKQPNIVVQVVAPVVAIAVRFGYLFLTTFVGLLTAAGIGVEAHALPVPFQQVFDTSLMSALVVGGMGVLKDAAFIFSGLEKKFPLGTGSV